MRNSLQLKHPQQNAKPSLYTPKKQQRLMTILTGADKR
jgi:hypothetical protein